MNNNVFVAPKIRIGFQERDDTFTGKLAYIIYYDERGKIRKEKSWESWRDKDIEPQEFENNPIEGFTLNKDIKRYHGGWFSSHRTMIRVHDPRGFEFEVTTENLIGILMHTDCLRRGLIGEFVYAWIGAELVLLPVTSEEYKNAVKYTSGLAKKVSIKSLVPGISYKTKREGDVVYIGKMNWYEYKTQRKNYYSPETWGQREELKVHVFTADNGETFFYKKSVEFLAEANTTVPVSNYAELVDKYNLKSYSKKIIEFKFKPIQFDPTLFFRAGYWRELKRSFYWVPTKEAGYYQKIFFRAHTKYVNPDHQSEECLNPKHIEGISVDINDHYNYLSLKEGKDMILKKNEGKGYRSTEKTLTDSDINKLVEKINILYPLHNLYIVFEDGTEQQIEDLTSIQR